MTKDGTHVHEAFMGQCLELALRGRGFIEPNPPVGALVVRNGQVLGVGWHQSLGGPHAEIHALSQAGAASAGADLYVTLEPCSTTGRTPPCTEAIRAAGIGKVIIGCLDPNPKHQGGAVALLEDAGIPVIHPVLEGDCEALLGTFRRHLNSARPVVVAKWAQTLDGHVATRSGDSRWITGQEARAAVHEERARSDAILVGVGTVLADDPQLTTRHVKGQSPRPVVLDTCLRIPREAALLTDASRAPLIYCGLDEAPADRKGVLESRGAVVREIASEEGRLDLEEVLRDLYRQGVSRLMVEGGPLVLGSFLDADLVDIVQVYLAPRVLGDPGGRLAVEGRQVDKIADTIDFQWIHNDQLGADLRLIGLAHSGG